MLAKMLRLLGFSAKIEALGEELDSLRETMRQANERVRDELQLAGPKELPSKRK